MQAIYTFSYIFSSDSNSMLENKDLIKAKILKIIFQKLEPNN